MGFTEDERLAKQELDATPMTDRALREYRMQKFCAYWALDELGDQFFFDIMDRGRYYDPIRGYLLLAAREAGLTAEWQAALMDGLEEAFVAFQAADAAGVYRQYLRDPEKP